MELPVHLTAGLIVSYVPSQLDFGHHTFGNLRAKPSPSSSVSTCLHHSPLPCDCTTVCTNPTWLGHIPLHWTLIHSLPPLFGNKVKLSLGGSVLGKVQSNLNFCFVNHLLFSSLHIYILINCNMYISIISISSSNIRICPICGWIYLNLTSKVIQS